MHRISSFIAAATLAVVLTAGPGFADDRPLIWKPAKNSDTSYSVKLGLRLPTRLEPEAGVSMGVDTTRSGAPVDTPLKFWSRFTAESIQTPAYEMNRGVGLNVDGKSGNAAITMNYDEKEIATPTLDLERNSSYAMRYDGATGEWCGIDASQSLRLSHVPTGTALIGRASGTHGFRTLSAGVGLEQKIGRHMTISGALDRTSDASEPAASLNARYFFTW